MKRLSKMRAVLAILVGKMVATFSRFFCLGAGETWPGEIGLLLDEDLIKKLIAGVKKGVILVAGTNGKTTTAKMIKAILKEKFESKRVVHNQSGANLLNGIASALISSASIAGKVRADWGVFEVDEATLPLALREFTPNVVVCLNLFRDQLDRYGEIDFIAENWRQALKKLPFQTTVVLNADDPQIAVLGKDLNAKVLYFGLEEQELFLAKIPHAADSIYCLSCGEKLRFKGVYFSHLGVWRCKNCGQSRPKPDLANWDWPLPGLYNRYNTLAALLVVKSFGVDEKEIKKALKNFEPAFGRGEEFETKGKKVKILLSKNPTGFNVTIKRVTEKPQKVMILALNDRIPDGRDVSWIWDVDFEDFVDSVDEIIVTGDRTYDLGLRLKYGGAGTSQLSIIPDLKEAIMKGLSKVKKGEVLLILPTYSAMLEIRKILGGKKIL